MLMDDGHRLLRATSGIEPLRRHFRLGVNFVESLVNRHRIEIYVLDAAGRITASFSRIHWDERDVVDRAAAMLKRGKSKSGSLAPACRAAPHPSSARSIASVAFFPKCPVCWAAT